MRSVVSSRALCAALATVMWLACVAVANAVPTITSVSAAPGGDRVLIEGSDLPADSGGFTLYVGQRTGDGLPWFRGVPVIDQAPDHLLLQVPTPVLGGSTEYLWIGGRYIHRVEFTDELGNTADFTPAAPVYIPSPFEAWPAVAPTAGPPAITSVQLPGRRDPVVIWGHDLDLGDYEVGQPGPTIEFIGTKAGYPFTQRFPFPRSNFDFDWSRTHVSFYNTTLLGSVITAIRWGTQADSPLYTLPSPTYVPWEGQTEFTGPVITVTSPAPNAVFGVNERARAGFTCQDESNVVRCNAAVVGGQALQQDGAEWILPTSTAGTFTVRVTAADGYLNVSTADFTYRVQPPDADGDGVVDSIDTGAGTFADGNTPPTTGAITDTGGLTVVVDDVRPPDGVSVTVGAGAADARVTMTVCGFTVRLAPGSNVVFTCGSLGVRTISGLVEVVSSDGRTVTAVPADSSAKFIAGSPDTVQQFTGPPLRRVSAFEAPVSSSSRAINVARVGQALPLRWSVTTLAGAPVTGLTSATVRATSVRCPLGPAVTATDRSFDVSSALQYLGRGRYAVGWRPPTALAWTCQRLRVDMGGGLTTPTAMFLFTR